MTRLTLAIAPIVPFCVLLTACGPRAATVVDDRDTYVETIADTICNEKQTCGEIGEEDSQYDNYDDCHSDAESFMRDLWPADECDQGRIAGDTFLDCDDRARLIACDGSIAEVYTAWDECNASEVCTDPAE